VARFATLARLLCRADKADAEHDGAVESLGAKEPFECERLLEAGGSNG
jgi:hypothetical protein